MRMNSENFFAELKRRNVYKVAVAYAIVGWLLIQIATQVFPFLEIPNWVVRLVIALVAIGFPIALVIAWAFEITPQGIERTEVADAMPSAAGQKKHAWIYVAVVGAVLSIGLFFLGRCKYSGRQRAKDRECGSRERAVDSSGNRRASVGRELQPHVKRCVRCGSRSSERDRRGTQSEADRH